MDPIRNPYAPGAGQRPPELAGRDEQLARLRRRPGAGRARPPGAQPRAHRAARRRQDRAAQRAALGGGRAGAGAPARSRPGRTRRCAARCRRAAPGGPRARPPAGPSDVDECSACSRPSRQRDAGRPAPSCATAGSPASTRPAVSGRADSGDIEIDLVELFTDVGGLAADVGQGRRDLHRRDAGPRARRRLRAVRRLPRDQPAGLPLIVVGAGLPHLPAVLSRQQVLLRAAVPLPAHRPARPARPPTSRCRARPSDEDADVRATRRSTRCTPRPAATRTSSRPTARRSGTRRRASPITADDVAVAAPEAEAELAVGFFGSRYERATPAEREYLRAMADAAVAIAERGEDGARRHRRVPTADVAAAARQEAAVAVARPATRCSRRA